MTAALPRPPYYAVIFCSELAAPDPDYEATATRMVELARAQPGFLGYESYRREDGAGVTLSYWRDLDAIRRWREHPEHAAAQGRGRRQWYRRYRLRIARVERDYGFDREAG